MGQLLKLMTSLLVLDGQRRTSRFYAEWVSTGCRLQPPLRLHIWPENSGRCPGRRYCVYGSGSGARNTAASSPAGWAFPVQEWQAVWVSASQQGPAITATALTVASAARTCDRYDCLLLLTMLGASEAGGELLSCDLTDTP